MTLAFLINFLGGVVALILGTSILTEKDLGKRFHATLDDRVKALLGPDYFVHPVLTGCLLCVLGLIFLGVSLAMFGKWNDFFVLSWL